MPTANEILIMLEEVEGTGSSTEKEVNEILGLPISLDHPKFWEPATAQYHKRVGQAKAEFGAYRSLKLRHIARQIADLNQQKTRVRQSYKSDVIGAKVAANKEFYKLFYSILIN